MVSGLSDFKNVFFIGIAGSGMSAIAQWLAGNGKQVSGSDRYFSPGVFNDTREKLEALGIRVPRTVKESARKLTWLRFPRQWKTQYLKYKKQNNSTSRSSNDRNYWRSSQPAKKQ